jgi:hypothetical protein
MKIAIVSKSDRIGGGASSVAEDLAIWLDDAGHPTDHFIAFNFKEPLSFQRSLYAERIRFKLCKKIHQKTKEYCFPQLYFLRSICNFIRILSILCRKYPDRLLLSLNLL